MEKQQNITTTKKGEENFLFPSPMQIQEYSNFLDNYNKFIDSQLQEQRDYGQVKGIKKHFLFKAGAEKLEKLMFLSHEKKCVERVFQKDFILYTYRTTIYDKNGIKKGTCDGSCNSKEKKYREVNYVPRKGDDIIELDNTIRKMAQKRSYVGAVLEATSSSGRFNCDEDCVTIPPHNANNLEKNVRKVFAVGENVTVEKKEKVYQDKATFTNKCSKCNVKIPDKVAKYSTDKMGKMLCYDCQNAQ